MLEIREPTTGPKPPSGAELASILAAYDALVQIRSAVEVEVEDSNDSSWRFANRWWNRSNVRGRGRPSRPSSFS